jgi:hypothetical protein
MMVLKYGDRPVNAVLEIIIVYHESPTTYITLCGKMWSVNSVTENGAPQLTTVL